MLQYITCTSKYYTYTHTHLPVSWGANSDIGNSDRSVLIPPSTDGEAVAGRALSLELYCGLLLHGGLVHISSWGRIKGYLEVDDVASVFKQSVDLIVSEFFCGCAIDAENMVSKLKGTTPVAVCVCVCVWEREREREREGSHADPGEAGKHTVYYNYPIWLPPTKSAKDTLWSGLLPTSFLSWSISPQ